MSPHDDLTNLIWITTFGKLLVRKGVLTKEEIRKELNVFAEGETTQLLRAEIEVMLRAVDKW